MLGMHAVIVPGRSGNLRRMRGGKASLFRGAGASARHPAINRHAQQLAGVAKQPVPRQKALAGNDIVGSVTYEVHDICS